MCAPAGVMRHNAFIYSSASEYVSFALAFAREGLEAGDAVILANTRPRLATMREALGEDASRVTLLDVNQIYTRPTRAIAAYFGALSQHLSVASSVRAIGEIQLGPPEDWRRWMAYEAASNLSYCHLPAWVVCTYDTDVLPDPILESVWRTHTAVWSENWQASPSFEDPRELVRELTPAAEPLGGLVTLPWTDDVEHLREMVGRALAAANTPAERALEMLLAVTEIATNAMIHGGGIAAVRTCQVAGRFVCEVVDYGAGFDDPAAGYIVPRESIGTGLWVARQLLWRLEFFHAPDGFTARLWL